MNAAPPAALQTAVATGGPADRVGRFILTYLDAQTFGLFATLVLIGWAAYCVIRHKPMSKTRALRLIAGLLEIYLAVTVWAVFNTRPPAVNLLHSELLPYIGLVTIIVMFSSAGPMLKSSFHLDGKGDDETHP